MKVSSPLEAPQMKTIWERYNSPIVWLLVVVYLGLAAIVVTILFPVQFLDRSQSGFFETQGWIAMGVLGLIGVWLSMHTGFPNAWDSKIKNRQRLVIPIVTGLLLGTLFLATDLVTGLSRLQQEQFNIPATDIAFPASVFVYSAGAIFLEVVFRLFTIPLLLGIAYLFVRDSKAREAAFWILAILTSLIEPLAQSPGTQLLPPLALGFVLLQQFGTNMVQAAFFRKYGFVAAILVRVAFYVPFHGIGAFLK
jgi:hypothetical protein